MSTKNNTAFEASHGEVSAATSKFLQELGEDGKRVVAQMNSDPAFRRRLANFAKAGGYSPFTDQKRAKEILGASYLGPEDVIKHFGVSFTDKELVQLREIPFTEAELEACKDTHVLFPGYSLSILDIRNKVEHLFYNQDWYEKEAFAKKEKVNLRWYLIRKEVVPNSTSKTRQDQQALLTSAETTPRACEVIFMAMLYFLATGKRLLERMYVRCVDVSSDGYLVAVGDFDTLGLDVSGSWGDRRDDDLGLASRWRLPSEI